MSGINYIFKGVMPRNQLEVEDRFPTWADDCGKGFAGVENWTIVTEVLDNVYRVRWEGPKPPYDDEETKDWESTQPRDKANISDVYRLNVIDEPSGD